MKHAKVSPHPGETKDIISMKACRFLFIHLFIIVIVVFIVIVIILYDIYPRNQGVRKF